MSATKERIPVREAERIAARFIDAIKDCCDRVLIAGSIRRGATLVGDIEIAAIPKVQPTTAEDMFGQVVATAHVDQLDARLTALLDGDVVAKRPRADGQTFWGPKAKYLTFEGMNVDLFSAVNDWRKAKAVAQAEPERFGCILVIRTGPAAYSHQLVTEKGKALFVGTDPRTQRPIKRHGLLPAHLRVQDGWLTYRAFGERIPTPEERDFFQALGLPYIEPSERR